MASAKKLPSGKWRTLVYIGVDEKGRRKYKSFTASNKRKSEHLAAEYADTNRITISGETLQAAIRSYIALKAPVLSPSTIKGYKAIERYFTASQRNLMDTPLYNITKESLQKVVNAMAIEGKSTKSIKNYYGFLASVLQFNDIHMKVNLPEGQKRELNIPDTKDIEAILDIAKGTEMEIPILLAAFGPLRRSEICGLQMEDISFETGTIHVKRAVVVADDGTLVTKGTKTYDSARTIPMPKRVMSLIKENGLPELNPHMITTRFWHITRKAGCPGVRFHDLRHWAASYLHAQGVPDKYILSRGGWKTDRVLKAVYTHTLTSEEDRWNKNIENMFQNIMQHGCNTHP